MYLEMQAKVEKMQVGSRQVLSEIPTHLLSNSQTVGLKGGWETIDDVLPDGWKSGNLFLKLLVKFVGIGTIPISPCSFVYIRTIRSMKFFSRSFSQEISTAVPAALRSGALCLYLAVIHLGEFYLLMHLRHRWRSW